jgi:hypothetical protein
MAYLSSKEKSVSGTKRVASFLSVYLQGNSMYSPGLSLGEGQLMGWGEGRKNGLSMVEHYGHGYVYVWMHRHQW